MIAQCALYTMPTTGALQLAGPPTKPHAHTHTRHTHIYIYICRVSCACVQEIGARVHDDCMLTTVCVALVYACIYIYIYIYIYTHTHANALYLSTGGSSVCGVVCVCARFVQNERAHTHTPHHKQTIPTALRPNGACPTAAATAATTTHPHTHTVCVCVCVWVGRRAASKQASSRREPKHALLAYAQPTKLTPTTKNTTTRLDHH